MAHFFCGNAFAETVAPALGQICEWTRGLGQLVQQWRENFAVVVVEPCENLASEHQALTVHIPNKQRFKRIAGLIAADHKLLLLMNFVLEPRIRAFPGFVFGSPPFGDDPFKLMLFNLLKEDGGLSLKTPRAFNSRFRMTSVRISFRNCSGWSSRRWPSRCRRQNGQYASATAL